MAKRTERSSGEVAFVGRDLIEVPRSGGEPGAVSFVSCEALRC